MDVRFVTFNGYQLAGTRVEVEVEVPVLVPDPIPIFFAEVVGDDLGIKTLSGQDVLPALEGSEGPVPSIRVAPDTEDEFEIKIDVFPPPNLG